MTYPKAWQQRARRVSWFWVVGLCLLSWTRSAHCTDERTEAEAHFNEALILLKAEKPEEAARELEVSVSLYPSKAGLYNLANCYRALGRYEDALRRFRQLESRYGDSLSTETRRDVGKQIGELEAILAAASPARAQEAPPPVAAMSQPARPPSVDTVLSLPQPVVFGIGAAGTVICTGISSALWGLAGARAREANLRLSAFHADLAGRRWDFSNPADAEAAASARAEITDRQASARQLNRAAVGVTVVTGVFAAMTAASFFIPKKTKKARLRPKAGPLEMKVTF